MASSMCPSILNRSIRSSGNRRGQLFTSTTETRLSPGAQQTVLIAEDEGEIRELLAMMFESEGLAVLKAADGEQALAFVKEHPHDIVLLVTDLGLPKLGGIELIQQARVFIPGLKVIAATGFGHINVRTELHNVGVEDFFPKPFSPIELLAAARRLLGES